MLFMHFVTFERRRKKKRNMHISVHWLSMNLLIVISVHVNVKCLKYDCVSKTHQLLPPVCCKTHWTDRVVVEIRVYSKLYNVCYVSA